MYMSWIVAHLELIFFAADLWGGALRGTLQGAVKSGVLVQTRPAAAAPGRIDRAAAKAACGKESRGDGGGGKLHFEADVVLLENARGKKPMLPVFF